MTQSCAKAAAALREQILTAAEACFHERGFKASTM